MSFFAFGQLKKVVIVFAGAGLCVVVIATYARLSKACSSRSVVAANMSACLTSQRYSTDWHISVITTLVQLSV